MENNDKREMSHKEKRVRSITKLFYSRPDIQEALFNFAQNREISPRFYEGFGKRPDTFEFKGDIFEMVKKGATSFHCSEELWKDPLEIATGMSEEQMNEIRKGWDLLIDIDSKYLDYSKISAEVIINVLRFHGVKNLSVKFSVSGDTPILIREGEEISLLPISKVIELLKKGKQIEVLSLDKNKKLKFSRIYDFLEHKDTVYEITHSQSTIPLKATGYHSVFVWEKGEIVEKEVTEIKKGDFLVSYNSFENPFSQNNKYVTNTFKMGVNKNSPERTIKRKVKLNKDLMRLIGYFLAEGHVTNIINQVGFTFNKNEKEYIEDVKELLGSITNRKISVRHPNSGSTQILIHSKEWATFFDNFCGKKKNKHVPNFVWTSSKEMFLELLKGYIRGDGYKVGEYAIIAKSVSKKLITEIVWLCKLNNISSSLSSEQIEPHKLPQGNDFKGSFVYMIRIPKSEIEDIEFNRKRNKFSPYAGGKIFPIDGLKEVYKQTRPKMFNYHRSEQMTLKKKRANLERIRKVLSWFYKFGEKEFNEKSKRILSNYEKLFSSEISVVEIREINEKEKEQVYDVSVEDTESFFGNYYPILLHNSGSKGFHIIVPWEAFPKEINGINSKDKFPEWPRIVSNYLMEKTKKEVARKINETFSDGEKYETSYKYIKGEKREQEIIDQVAPDIVLVAPRHLFRMPYSLHEKTALASIVLSPEEVRNFELKDADPLKIPKGQVKNFYPKAEPGEAKELLLQALDWDRENRKEDSFDEPGNSSSQNSFEGKNFGKRDYSFLSNKEGVEKFFPPCIKEILKGMEDGKKRSVFVLINFFRTINMDRSEVEKRIYDWNKKNPQPLKEGYIKTQISWSYQKKSFLPPNCKQYYQGLGVCKPDRICQKIKNPINYPVLKHKIESQFSRQKENSKKDKKQTKKKSQAKSKKTNSKKKSDKIKDTNNSNKED